MRLLFNVERDRDEADVLLATVFEALAEGRTRTTDELLVQVQADWPGIVLSREKLETTLEVARERGFLEEGNRLDSSAAWATTKRAEIGVHDSRMWAENVLLRCHAQIQDRMREVGTRISVEQAELWTNILLAALNEGICSSFSQCPTGTREVANRLFPPYDAAKILSAVKNRVDDPDTAEILGALALSALDPASTFGSEVVHYLATGYVLYALLLGYDLIDSRDQVGDLSGVVLLLDTPVLLRLLSGGKEFRWTTDLVGHIANRAGACVAVALRTRRELTEMLSQRDYDASRIEEELSDGVPRQNLAYIAPDEVLAVWLREPSAPSWDQFKQKAEQLLRTLKAIGVEVDYKPADYISDTATMHRYADAIRRATGERTGRMRSVIPAEHDGELLCIASHLRSGARRRGDSERIWPAAFVMTTDKSLNDAYRSVAVDDQDMPLALTISQSATLLARFAQAADTEKLAELIATDHQWQARFVFATAFGTDQAIEMARSFSATELDALLVEATSVQLTFDELISTADYHGDPTKAARQAVVIHEQRRRSAQIDHERELDAERIRERERTAAEGARAEALFEQARRQSDMTRDLQAENVELQERVQVRNRAITVILLYVATAAVLAILVGFHALRGHDLFLPAAGMLGALKWLYDWTTHPKQHWLVVLISAVAWAGLAAIGHALF
jgi:hypothetical protein